LIHEGVPNSSFQFARRGEKATRISLNEWGFRDGERDKVKKGDVIRIAVLGDSNTAGWEVPLQKTFGARLEEMLNEASKGNKRIEVLNFGVEGYGFIQYFHLIKFKVLQFDPDFILIVTGANDILDDINYGLARGNLESINFPFYSEFLYSRSPLYAFIYSRLFRLKTDRQLWVNLTYKELIAKLTKSSLPFEEQFRETSSAIDNINKLLKFKNIPWAFILSPDASSVTEKWFEDLTKTFSKNYNVPVETAKGKLVWGREALKSFCHRYDIQFLDLMPAFETAVQDLAAYPYLEQDPHLSSTGHELVAREIFSWIISQTRF